MLAKDELLALLQKCAEILQLVKSKKMKKALVQLSELLTKLRQMDGKRWRVRVLDRRRLMVERLPTIHLTIVCRRLMFCFVFGWFSSSSSSRSYRRCRRHCHLSCQEPSKENRSFPAAEGLWSSPWRDTTSPMCRDSFISRCVLQTLLEMNESRRAKKTSPFELLQKEVVEFIDSLVK